jgi:DNA/RNA endonuclease YhcR with UshA esterase domain
LKIKNKQEKKMKNLRNLLATVTLMAVMMIGAVNANAGLLVSDFTGTPTEDPCSETKVDSGIIVTGFTGIIVTGFTGIIVTGAVDSDTNCGILMTD